MLATSAGTERSTSRWSSRATYAELGGADVRDNYMTGDCPLPAAPSACMWTIPAETLDPGSYQISLTVHKVSFDAADAAIAAAAAIATSKYQV